MSALPKSLGEFYEALELAKASIVHDEECQFGWHYNVDLPCTCGAVEAIAPLDAMRAAPLGVLLGIFGKVWRDPGHSTRPPQYIVTPHRERDADAEAEA